MNHSRTKSPTEKILAAMEDNIITLEELDPITRRVIDEYNKQIAKLEEIKESIKSQEKFIAHIATEKVKDVYDHILSDIWIKATEAAKLRGISREAIGKAARKGKMETYKDERGIRYVKIFGEEVKKFIKGIILSEPKKPKKPKELFLDYNKILRKDIDCSDKMARIGLLRAKICEIIIENINKKKMSVELIYGIVKNTILDIAPELLELLNKKELSTRTLRRWVERYRHSEHNFVVLIPNYKKTDIGKKEIINGDEFVTRKEICEKYGINRQTLADKLRNHSFPSKNLTPLLYLKKDIEDFLITHPTKNTKISTFTDKNGNTLITAKEMAEKYHTTPQVFRNKLKLYPIPSIGSQPKYFLKTDAEEVFRRYPPGMSMLECNLRDSGKEFITVREISGMYGLIDKDIKQRMQQYSVPFIGEKGCVKYYRKKDIEEVFKELPIKNSLVEVRSAADSEGDLLTVTQIAKEYDLSNLTIRRRLAMSNVIPTGRKPFRYERKEVEDVISKHPIIRLKDGSSTSRENLIMRKEIVEKYGVSFSGTHKRLMLYKPQAIGKSPKFYNIQDIEKMFKKYPKGGSYTGLSNNKEYITIKDMESLYHVSASQIYLCLKKAEIFPITGNHPTFYSRKEIIEEFTRNPFRKGVSKHKNVIDNKGNIMITHYKIAKIYGVKVFAVYEMIQRRKISCMKKHYNFYKLEDIEEIFKDFYKMSEIKGKKLFTAKEIAERYSIDVTTVNRIMRKKKLKHWGIRPKRYVKDDVDELFMSSLRVKNV